MMNTKSGNIILRFAIIYFVIVLGFVCIVGRIWNIQHAEKNNWIALSDSLRKINKEYEIEASRGNIYSDNGQLLASSVPEYYLYIDFRTSSLRADTGKLFRKNIDSLAYCLSAKFKDRTKSEYKAYLTKGYKDSIRNYPIYKKKVSYTDYKEIKAFPLFREGSRSGFIAKERVKRVKPYGTLGAITIGDLFGEKNKGAKYGIEASYDSLLRGKPGKAHIERRAGANILVSDQEPEDGADITSTLNIEMQDLADKALREKLISLDAEWGCAVLMEVETGQVKACVNLKKYAEDDYREMESIVLRTHLEPGSTFKIPAMMAALEDGITNVYETVDCGDGVWKFSEKVTISDHNTGKNANGVIPVTQAIVRSSNVGMAKIIYNGYKENPQKYVDRLEKMGVGMPMDVGFKGAVKASVSKKKNDPSWLVSAGYGYSVDMPVLYTLAFYNAIANNGKMMQPYFIKEIKKNGMVEKAFEPVVLKNSICSSNTLSIIKEMMLQVVEDPEHGTGKPVKSDYVRIAGKTGTARYDYKNKGEKLKYQVSFCGFFPYENPKYSCIVFIRNPKSVGEPGGGYMAGPVFKEIAERVMALESRFAVDKYVSDSARVIKPVVAVGNTNQKKQVIDFLNKSSKEKNIFDWNNLSTESKNDFEIPYKNDNNAVPSVVGMGLKDAIYLLETSGLKVRTTGRGRVKSQSIASGIALQKGAIIYLVLE